MSCWRGETIRGSSRGEARRHPAPRGRCRARYWSARSSSRRRQARRTSSGLAQRQRSALEDELLAAGPRAPSSAGSTSSLSGAAPAASVCPVSPASERIRSIWPTSAMLRQLHHGPTSGSSTTGPLSLVTTTSVFSASFEPVERCDQPADAPIQLRRSRPPAAPASGADEARVRHARHVDFVESRSTERTATRYWLDELHRSAS